MGAIKIEQNFYSENDITLNYYEVKNNLPALFMIHAQGTNATSYNNTLKEL